MQNRRLHQRFEAAVAAEISIKGEVYEAETRDISEGGVSALLDGEIEEDATVQLALILTQDGIEDPNHEPLELQARVIWVAPHDGGGCMAGLRFVAVSAQQKAEIDRFLSALSRCAS